MLEIIAVGKMKKRPLIELCADYTDRLSHFDKIKVIEIKDSTPEKEGDKILESVKNFRGKIYALGEEGKEYTSYELSKILEQDLISGGSAFIVGGPYGISAKVKESTSKIISMSKLTFTHEFARAILLEQLYRAKTITAGTGYHHEGQ